MINILKKELFSLDGFVENENSPKFFEGKT